MRVLLRSLVVLGVLSGCTTSPTGPGGLALRPGVTVVHDFEPISVACRAESLCPQYIDPHIADVAHVGGVWVVLYHWYETTDPLFGGRILHAGYFVSRDDGATWTEPDWDIPSYGAYNHLGGFAVPMDLFVSAAEIYQFVPFERDERGNYQHQVWRLDLDGNRLVHTGTLIFPLVVGNGDSLVFYNRGSSSEYNEYDPATDTYPTFLTEVYTPPPRHSPLSPLAWARTNPPGRPLRLIGFSIDQYLASSPLLRCVQVATPPAPLYPELRCVPDTGWPVPDDASMPLVMFADGEARGFAGGLWTEGTGVAERTRGLQVFGTADAGRVDTYELGSGRLLLPADGGSDRHDVHDGYRFGDLVALTREIEDGSRRTTLYRFSSASAFEPTTLPTRPCADGVDCGYRPRDFFGVFSDSALQWATPLAGDEYRMFYVVDAATPTHNHLVMLTSVERLDRGAATAGSALERACALEQACLFGLPDIESCVRSWLSPVEAADAAYERFIAASTCAEIFAADPGNAVAFGAPCTREPLECRGAVAVSCSGGTVGATFADCGRTGGTCSILPDGNVSCAPASVDCATSAGTCDASGRAVLCTPRGVLDCPAAGLTCELEAAGAPACVLRTPACTEPVTTVCDGDRVVTCAGPGVGSVAADCSRLPGLSCNVIGISADCDDGSGACDATVRPRCQGSELVLCIGTSLRSVDCASLGMTCGVDGASRARCISSALPDAGVPAVDAGPPACGSAALTGPTVSENVIPDYPTATGGVIADGTYVLTQYDVWSASAQAYTHQETLVFSGSTLEIIELHSLIGLSSSTGTYSTLDVNLGYEASCPFTRSSTWRYSATASGIVVMDGSFIRTYARL